MTRKLYQTPPSTPEELVCRTLKIPSSLHWLGIFNASLLTMVKEYNWEQVNDTDLTIDETIIIVRSMIEEYWDTLDCGEVAPCELPDNNLIFRIGISGRYEQLVDGQWVSPTGDSEIPAIDARSETTEVDRRCLAAMNAANVLEELYEVITDEIAAESDALQIIAALVAAAVTALGGWIAAPLYAILQLSIALFIGMIELLQQLGADVWTAEFDTKLKCALFNCATDTAGVVTFDLSCIREELTVVPDVFNPTIFYEYQLFAQILFLMETITEDGLNVAGTTTAITTGNCADCEPPCPMPNGHFLNTLYQCESLTFTPDDGTGYHAPSFRTYRNMDSAKIHLIELGEYRCFDGIRVDIFRYTAGQGATCGCRIRPVGGTWGPTASMASTAGTWGQLDVAFDNFATGEGYSVDRFEIETMNANSSNYMPFDKFQLWEAI